MAMAWVFSVAMIFFTFAGAAASLSDSVYHPSITFVNSTSSRNNAMILPLFFKQRNNKEGFHSRRHLQARSIANARMPLHDDLLLNGYYTTRVWIGTPPQRFALIVDTGSTVTYVPCATCEQCGKHQDPKFQPESSSSYKPLKCKSDCVCDSERVECIYERQYAEMSSSSGVLGVDIISFGNQSDLKPQRATFGCENRETGALYSQNADGIMGLGRGDLSIMDQLVKKGVVSNSFSLCYGGMDVGGGAMVLGGISPPNDMVFTPSDPLRSPYYNIELSEIHVAGKKLPLDPKVFDGKHGTILDSGTTYAYFPEAAFLAFKEAIDKETQSLNRIRGPDPNYDDICFSGAGSDAAQLSKVFPSVEMVFGNAEKLLLAPENYLFRHTKVHGAYCLGIFQNGLESTTLLGGVIVQNTLVTYDREHEKVGFWKTNCSELWHLSPAPPPLPSATVEVNASIPMPPKLAPAQPPQPPQPITPGETRVGRITFSMLLSVNSTELKPHISELHLILAKDLDVNSSQLHLMNLGSKENNTLLRWAIFPAESDDYIANATALNIISRLSGNQLHIPDSFGSYKLSEWRMEPPPNKRPAALSLSPLSSAIRPQLQRNQFTVAPPHLYTTSIMAWVFTLAIIFFTAAAASLSDSPYHPSITFLNSTSSRSNAMILPLFFKQRNDHRHKEAFFSRRHLHERSIPNARMPLHDDLLLNGYYTTRLWIGTPPQRFALIVDTGSTVTYVPCATCEQCGKHQDPKFQPELSSTYEPLKCNIDCTCDSDREQCIYERQYAEMSSSSGVLGVDVISFGNQSDLQPQRATFGCENMETGDLYSQHADGIMGLGRGDLSIVDQLVEKGVVSDSFSLCYGGMDVGGGAMVLGGISPPNDMVFTRSDPVRSPYYNIELSEIHVAGKKLPLNPKVFDGKHGTVLDSGTTYAYLPEAAFLAFKEAIVKETQSLKRIQGPDPNYNDICFSGAGSDPAQLSKAFPSVRMVFGNSEKLLLAPENYLFRHSKVHGAYCLGIFQNGKESTTLLGGIIVRNTLVTYDREHEKVGFWKTNCSELWERLHLSPAPLPLPSGTVEVNATIPMAPKLAPAEPPQPKTPGETKVGRITFFMLLTVNYTELKPHISELAHIIAKDLDVNSSQVQLMNLTSKENNTLLRWAIFPAESDDHIANATAMIIISRLSGNQLHLPDSFGSYKLFEWRIEPPPKRTWWQRHYLGLVVASVLVIVIGLLASGAWLIWKKRNVTEVPYKPVDSVVAEQELQPLQN